LKHEAMTIEILLKNQYLKFIYIVANNAMVYLFKEIWHVLITPSKATKEEEDWEFICQIGEHTSETKFKCSSSRILSLKNFEFIVYVIMFYEFDTTIVISVCKLNPTLCAHIAFKSHHFNTFAKCPKNFTGHIDEVP
jgi:hypothetical protein